MNKEELNEKLCLAKKNYENAKLDLEKMMETIHPFFGILYSE